MLLYAALYIDSFIFLYTYTNLQLAILTGVGGGVEVEQNFIDRRLIALTAYYGELSKDC